VCISSGGMYGHAAGEKWCMCWGPAGKAVVPCCNRTVIEKMHHAMARMCTTTARWNRYTCRLLDVQAADAELVLPNNVAALQPLRSYYNNVAARNTVLLPRLAR
jgi:hypothetical protein